MGRPPDRRAAPGSGARHRHGQQRLGLNRVLPVMHRLPGISLIAALALAALLRPLRLPLAIGLLVAYLASGRRGSRSAVLAAGLPVAAILAWAALGQPAAAADAAQCTDVFAPPAVWRFSEGRVGRIRLGGLLVGKGGPARGLGRRLGAPRVSGLAPRGPLPAAPPCVAA